jgi:flavin reductase (DIM6/NTAB) family NADH-FMN oxidoreductase RutF
VLTRSEDLRQVMRNWASGITVVTASDGTQWNGMTVSSFTSISLEPPRVLISLEQTTRTHQQVKQNGYFGITILSQDQASISDRFAGRKNTIDDNRFEGLATETLSSGVPFIIGGLAFLDCHIVHSFDTGTHTLFIGDVIAMSSSQDGQPLLHYNREYHTLGKPEI